MIRASVAAFRLQLWLFRRTPASLSFFALVPLQCLIFNSLVAHNGRTDLVGYAVLAPGVLAVLGMAIFEGGEIVTNERAGGTLEGLLATPTPLPAVLLGRVTAVTLVSLTTVAESWMTTGLVFGQWVAPGHPGITIATLLIMAFAVAGTTTAMAALFVLSRSVRSFQNSLLYPMLLLGGAFVPVELLPQVFQPLSRFVFLSWATGLLRDAVADAPVEDVALRLSMLLGLGAVGFSAGLLLFRAVLHNIQARGTVSFT
ncbi:ABC transporter permease [Streptomyces tendae]|uniref:ABC transporter permease n=1 Tax=Streptomyces tendae TaxID=1932 RepID=UPI0036B370EC